MVSPTVDAIDVGYLGLDRAAASFLVCAQGQPPILIECGTAACQPRLHRALDERGLRPADIAGLFVTHIHLDHAGGAGHFAAEGVPVYVHPFGVRHLADPSKLIASSRRVHGPSYDRFYGDPLPCPPQRLHATPDGTVMRIAGLRVTAIETPGHARHHHAWLVEEDHPAPSTASIHHSRHLFTGDVASMRVPGSEFISVPMPPPEFDLAAWRHSLDRLTAALRAGGETGETWTTLWLTHFGPILGGSGQALAHIAEARRRLDAEAELVRGLVEEQDRGLSDTEAVARYGAWLWPQAAQAGVSEAQRSAFLGPSFCRMNLHGVRRWRDQVAAAERAPG